MAKPFLKWAGGKTQLLPEIMARVPLQYGRYYEPFLGGGAVFFSLAPDRATLSDVNSELIETYRAVRDDVGAVIEALQGYRCSEEDYYRARAQDASGLTSARRAARLIFLNRTCFNGLYRVNRAGQFNVPFGRYVNPTICHADNLVRVSEAIRRVRLRCQPVFSIARQARRGDFVYFDPPYVPASPTARFVGYARGGFGEREQRALASLFASLSKRGVRVMLSNSDVPLVRHLYRHFRIEQVMARRSINRAGTKRGLVPEVLISAGMDGLGAP